MSELETPPPQPPQPPEGSLPPPPPPSAGEDSRPPGADDRRTVDTDIDVTIGTAEAHKINVVGQIKYVNQYFPHGEGVHPFSIRHTVEVKVELETAIAEQFVHDDALIAAALADLENRRMLLLSGERNTGKATMAIYLSTHIGRKRAFRNPTLSVRPLDERIDIAIPSVAENASFHKRVVVFTDVLDARNQDLLQFFRHADRIQCAELTEKLRAHDAYLIFTASATKISSVQQRLADSIAWKNVEQVPHALVKTGFDRKLAWLEKKELASAEHLSGARANRDRIISQLRTVQRVSMFLDHFVVGDPNVDVALERFDNVELWFEKDLPADVDAWCCALTLAIAQCALGGTPAGWYEFERVRRAIAETVKSDPEIFPRRRRSDAPADIIREQQTSAQMLSDDRLLARCRAEIVSGSRLGDVVSFIDPDHAKAIWRCAVSHNRRVLTAMVPVLRALAEDERGASNYAVRALAAQMLGWIGEIDPFSITVPLVQQEWVGARDRGQRPFVGKLLLGVHRSENPAYKQVAMGAIDSFLLPSGDEQLAGDRVLTAMSAYSQLGVHEYEPAMARLGRIAIEQLAPVMENLHSIERLLERVDRQLSRTASRRHAEDLLFHRFRLGHLANRISPAHVSLVLALKQAVLYLCVMTDAVSVLCATREWIARGGESTGTLVALLLLHGGIAEELESLSRNAGSLDGSSFPSSIVRALSGSEEASQRMAGFLADVHAAVHRPFSLPADLQNDLEERFSEALTAWARNASAHPNYAPAVERLFTLLMTVRGGALKDTIYALLATQPFTEEPALRGFATAIRKRHLQDATGGLT